MKLEFQSMLFRTARDLTDAIAAEWLTAGGLNDAEEVAEALATYTDTHLAREAIDAWDLNAEWLDARGIDASDIVAAFSRIRE